MSITAPALVVGSGKGGVGKSVAAIAMAAEFAAQGRRVLLLDGDQNLGTLHVLLGIVPALPLESLLDGYTSPEALVAPVAPNLWLLPSSSGSEAMYGLSPTDRARLQRQLSGLYGNFDVTVIDAGAGLESVVRCVMMRATRLVLITTPEPAALTDAYAVVKIVSLQAPDLPIDVVSNRAGAEAEGRAAYERLAAAAERFLRRGLRYVGSVPEDPGMRAAIEHPAQLLDPNGPAAMRAIRALAAARIDLPPPLRLAGAGD
ncbi:MAG: P-loop NTPase [Gemmatimonadales bacterium]|nr:P-loop NTPase [Gemmatimonadales bacterium]